eukprot:6805720-Prymnesium_polylepis.1
MAAVLSELMLEVSAAMPPRTPASMHSTPRRPKSQTPSRVACMFASMSVMPSLRHRVASALFSANATDATVVVYQRCDRRVSSQLAIHGTASSVDSTVKSGVPGGTT